MSVWGSTTYQKLGCHGIIRRVSLKIRGIRDELSLAYAGSIGHAFAAFAMNLTISSYLQSQISWPQIRQDYPLNLSILLSGGKETNKDSLSNGEWTGKSSNSKSSLPATANCSLEKCSPLEPTLSKLLGKARRRGWQPLMWHRLLGTRSTFRESGCLGLQPKVGGILHLKLNIGTRPIANKYREGKMKRTLKRELKSAWNRWKGSE